jgi:hypothetical protein
MVDTSQKECLYCSDPADSPEHIFPEGLGGRSPKRILCGAHNHEVASKCDEPLVESLAFFVHVFRIKRKHGAEGIAIPGADASGTGYKINAQFKPELSKTAVIQQCGPDGRPSKFTTPNLNAANKIIKTMNLPIDAVVTSEEQSLSSPEINLDLQFGGPEPFRGILKIAYELARGILNATVTDAIKDASIRAALLDDADPMPFVKWLPYDKIPAGLEPAFFSSRIIAWQSGNEVLAVVEFFNCLPFVVRLPGVSISTPALYVQSVHGGEPMVGTIPGLSVPWVFSDIPDHAQPDVIRDFPVHFEPILKTYMFSQLLLPVTTATGEQFVADSSAPDADIQKAVIEDVTALFGRPLKENEDTAARIIIQTAITYLRSNSA